jgi:glycosyltransferase involved in cell wall biosynthesis
MGAPFVSVVICSHNPRPHYISRAVDALRSQTLPRSSWELLLVDNASSARLADSVDLSWHPKARHIREDELGLTPARLRGIAEAKGDLLVFVDDDNVLAPDYLEQAIAIGEASPWLGAWGGIIVGEFEAPPEPWIVPHLGYLGIREFSAPIWSNNSDDTRAQPCGAGICVRAGVARTYAAQVAEHPLRRKLDRVGEQLISGGDNDLLGTSCDVGLGYGNFPELRLTHLIPARRLTLEYMARLVGGITISGSLLRYYRSGVLPEKPGRLKTRVRWLITLVRFGRHRAALYKASQDAKRTAARIASSQPPASAAAPPGAGSRPGP